MTSYGFRGNTIKHSSIKKKRKKTESSSTPTDPAQRNLPLIFGCLTHSGVTTGRASGASPMYSQGAINQRNVHIIMKKM